MPQKDSGNLCHSQTPAGRQQSCSAMCTTCSGIDDWMANLLRYGAEGSSWGPQQDSSPDPQSHMGAFMTSILHRDGLPDTLDQCHS